jgi:hypothetical protein
MSEYFWTANGHFIEKKIIEHLSTDGSHFNVKEDQICIDETCLSKNDISQLKGLLPSFNIIERSSSLEILTEYEIKLYLKEIFKQLFLASSDIDKIGLLNKYFIYGLYDPKSGDKLSFNNFFLQKNDNVNVIDFQDIYLNVDSMSISVSSLPENMIIEAIKTNNMKASDRLVFVLSLGDVQNLGVKYYAIMYKNYTIQLMKLNILGESIWKFILFTNNMIESMYIKQDEIFNLKFKNSLDIINIFNQRNELKLTEFRNYIDNIRAVSLLDGKFNLDVFKNNIFTNFYKKTLDLTDLIDDHIMKKIYNPVLFDKKNITLLQDEKNHLGYYELHNSYILLENSEELELRLIYGKKNSTDIYKWMLVYMKKE